MFSHEDGSNDNFPNKRMSHLMELLNQNTGSKITDVPPIVFEKINKELIKHNINKCDLNIQRLRRILKKLNYRKYCEYDRPILYYISGIELPIIEEDHKIKIIKVFKEISNYYRYCCPPDRISFFNFNYVLHKICELIGMNEYLGLFPLPYKTNYKKRTYNELMWKKLCEYRLNDFIKELTTENNLQQNQ